MLLAIAYQILSQFIDCEGDVGASTDGDVHEEANQTTVCKGFKFWKISGGEWR